MAEYLILGGVSKNGSPPCSACTSTPSARSSITLLRICTMSENPTSSSLFASRKPLCFVVIIANLFLPGWEKSLHPAYPICLLTFERCHLLLNKVRTCYT